MALQFSQVAKRINDTVIFPAFDLTIQKGQVGSFYCNVNVREQLVALFLGTSRLSQGEMKLCGKAIERHQVGVLLLEPAMYERLTVAETLQFTKRLYHSTKTIEEAIQTFQLENLQKTKIKKLSFSEKKRVQLACLTIQNPICFILVEPDQNLDIESTQIFLNFLEKLRQNHKITLILTSNLESAVVATDDVFQLNERGCTKIQITKDGQRFFDQDSTIDGHPPFRFEKIPTKVEDKIILFNPPEIDYIESQDGQSFLFCNGASFPTTFTLNELEQRLLPFGFFRCHRSYIVNLQKVREVITWTRNSYSLKLHDQQQTTIPLSKSRMAELKAMIGLK